MNAFFAHPIVDQVLRSVATAILVLSFRVGWDGLEALHRAVLPVWPVITNALPLSIAMGIALPFALKRTRQRLKDQEKSSGV